MVVTGFATVGIPAFFAYLVAYVELLGGLAVILGVLSRYAAGLISVVMLVALFKVHWPNGYGLQNGGYEYVLALLLMALAIITLGAGKYSIIKLFKRERLS